MPSVPLRTLLSSAGRLINGWCSLPCAYAAEILSHQGYDTLTIDMQHGAMGYDTAFAMLQAIGNGRATPLVRVPWHDPGLMMRMLDAGAMGLICPMVDTPADAETFVRACRYPPRGSRSFGPNRAVLASGAASSTDYAARAQDEIALFAMIETKAGLDNLGAILQVDGLDGVYVGPGDLSLALGAAASMAPRDATVLAAMATIRVQAKAAGRIVAVHTDGPETARQRFAEGFDICTLQNDARLLADAARAQAAAARG
ncbi:MAG: aldolase/citrate lyase family protein [Hyphomicrobiaceae bacterium]|nr:aldolase/citrate lyase family protein [Hyphomicrobiaceae bacterium]